MQHDTYNHTVSRNPVQRPKTAAAAEAAEARAKAAAARADKAADKANHPSQWTWQQLQPVLSAEQKRWRSNLAAYLGRPVDVPLLAPGAPVLDVQELFTRVGRGATSAVCTYVTCMVLAGALWCVCAGKAQSFFTGKACRCCYRQAAAVC